jgi:hypothetical protein
MRTNATFQSSAMMFLSYNARLPGLGSNLRQKAPGLDDRPRFRSHLTIVQSLLDYDSVERR